MSATSIDARYAALNRRYGAWSEEIDTWCEEQKARAVEERSVSPEDLARAASETHARLDGVADQCSALCEVVKEIGTALRRLMGTPGKAMEAFEAVNNTITSLAGFISRGEKLPRVERRLGEVFG